MNNASKNRWQVRVAAMVIFVIGFAAGILALNVYRRVAGSERPRDRIEQMARRLNLTDDQKTKVQEIFSDTREQVRALRRESEPKFEDIRRQADTRLQQVLTAEQWEQFQKERHEMRGRRGGRGGPRGDDR
ncbi:MAG TPA: Spy/CpxP family protein refolding chaperone [Pyrinomonadaceae bacterium]|nr:Spy/CpxP family protein refolding chaperone [Pyrinomonadaceae bacterium]